MPDMITQGNTALNALSGLTSENRFQINVAHLNSLFATQQPRLLKAAASAQPAVAIDTFGYDFVYGANLARVNACLRQAQMGSNALGSFNIPDSGGLLSFSIDGKFGSAYMSKGGSGKLVNLEFPLEEGTFRHADYKADLSGSVLLFQAKLKFETVKDAQDKGGKSLLLVDFASLTFLDFTKSTADLVENTELYGLVSGAMTSYLKKQGNKKWQLAEVNLGMEIQDGYDWLVPTSVDYAFNSGQAADGHDAVLGLLCLTENESSESLVSQVCAQTLFGKNPASVLVGPKVMMEKMVMPSLPFMFDGTTLSDFSYHADSYTISNTDDVALEDITYNFRTYHPKMDVLNVTLRGTQIYLYAHVKVHLAPGQTGVYSIAQTYDLEFGADGQVISYRLSDQQQDHHLDTSAGGEFLKDLFEILARTFGLVIGALALIFKAVIFCLNFFFVFGMDEGHYKDVIKKAKQEETPIEPICITPLIEKMDVLVEWLMPEPSGAVLGDAQLNRALQLSGFATNS